MDDSTPDSDAQSVQLTSALAGDHSAVCELAETWRAYLKAVAAEVLGHTLPEKLDPSDVVQCAVLAAVEHLSQFKGATLEELRAWLAAIVRNEARQTQRHFSRERRDTARQVPLEPRSGSAHMPADNASSVSAKVMRSEQATRLFAALEGLRAEDREVIYLRHFVGLPHAEIAKRLGRSEAAVRQLLSGALERLRAKLGPER
jgi:RNA polymerase sigma-70 factor (ECF subfamily)